uniref:THO complex subunit 1 n=1 Tax=Oryza punctata TaxID=4537 RepID=A0A0E0K7Q4_ORYPU
MAELTPPPSSNAGLRILLSKDRPPSSSSSTLASVAAVSSHTDRDRIIGVFRDALSRTESPEAFALQAVQDAIKPQKQTVLVLEENQSLENALRKLLQELASSAVQSGKRIMQYGDNGENNCPITRLLDIVLYLCERGHVEGGMVFQLLEDLTEMSTIKDCKDVFGYIESKQDVLGKQELFGRGKLVMLRTCNQLLRRLSKANDVVFCGRIIMFLAHFFPLSERSALNIKGVFNTSNETKYEKAATDGISVDFNFYNTLWSLQEHFSNPALSAANLTRWQKFASNLTVVLSTFEAQPLSDDDGKLNNLDQEEDAAFNIKYLTSSKLMGLELKDPSFRRHILVQCLIFFDFLKAPGKTDKEGPTGSMKEEIDSCEERVKKLLEIIPPKGKEFLQSIEHILEREKNWHLKNNLLKRNQAKLESENGVVPQELLPPEVRSKFYSKPGDKAKRPKREDPKGTSAQPKEQQIVSATPETDGGGSGAEPEEGAVPMDSDNATIDEGRKQSPEEVSEPESGQCEAEGDGEDNNMKNEASKDGPSKDTA